MKIVSKEEMKKLPRGTVFIDNWDYGDIYTRQVEIKDDYEFGARMLLPDDNEDDPIFDYDWNINEYRDDQKFLIFEKKDIIQMISLLAEGLIDGSNN